MNADSEDYSDAEPESLRDNNESAGHDGGEQLASNSAECPPQRLSCDNCRNRKVRCERGDPCLRCLRAKISCTYTTAQRPLRVKRARVLVSNQYEDKIDEISRKMDTICKLFNDKQGIPRPQGSPVKQDVPAHHTSAAATSAASPVIAVQPYVDDAQPCEPEFEGDSALSAHTAFATEFLQSAIDSDPSTPIPPETASALHELHLNVSDPFEGGESLLQQLPNAALTVEGPVKPEMSMPPAELVLVSLQLAKQNPRIQYMGTYEFESIEHFQHYFLSVYGSSQHTVAERLIFLAGVLPLFSECACILEDQSSKDRYTAQAALSRDTLETLLTSLPFHLPSTYDYVLALALAANYSIGRSRPALAWNFNCTAARMSQAMGFHKAALQETAPTEAVRRKARVFRIIYATDKMLSLRLGRGSVIRDSEMPVDQGTMLRWVNTAPNKFPPTWVRFAQIQGSVYARLYSPEALRQPATVRAARALGLSRELDEDTANQCEYKAAYDRKMHQAIGDDLWDLLYRGDRVARLALMCLIHRNIPPPAGSSASFSEECVSIAREALAEHHMCNNVLAGELNGLVEFYYIWALLTSPFVPFIVLLCNVAETYNMADLELLGTMIASIEKVGESIPAVSKQLRLFKPLFEVTSEFVQAKMAPVPLPGDFDAFLEDVRMDIPLDPALLSTFGPIRSPDVADRSQPGHADTSIIDIWSYLDSPHSG